MHRLFPPSDPYVARCGDLRAFLAERPVTGAPPFLHGLTALFVADVHVLPRTTPAQLDALAERIDGIGADLLLLGGDYSDDAAGAIRFFEALAPVKPPLGCYGVIGNNDAEAWAGRLEALGERMARAGCAPLMNRSAILEIGGGTLYLAGVDEHRYGHPDPVALYPDSPAPNAYRVLLSHFPIRPAVLPDLMLSGHTHGGQFNLLGLTPFAIGFERVKEPAMAVSGMHDIDGMKLLVSKGIGASRIQLRVGVRPEIDLLRFQ